MPPEHGHVGTIQGSLGYATLARERAERREGSRGGKLAMSRRAHDGQMPWETIGLPMTRVREHHAHTTVGHSRILEAASRGLL